MDQAPDFANVLESMQELLISSARTIDTRREKSNAMEGVAIAGEFVILEALWCETIFGRRSGSCAADYCLWFLFGGFFAGSRRGRCAVPEARGTAHQGGAALVRRE